MFGTRAILQALAGTDPDALPSPKRAPELKRFIIVIGPTGVGKSTIVNMMHNESHTPDMCVVPARVADTSDSVTKFPGLYVNIRSGSCIVDTVGIGDPTMDQAMLERAIRGLVMDTAKGINTIVVVMKMGRVSDADRANLALLTELFHPSDLKSHGMLVATHWEGELGKEQDDIDAWVAGDPGMQTILQMFAKVLPTNNSLKGRYAYEECRSKRLAEILEFVNSKEERVFTRPVNIMELVLRILKKFIQFFIGPPRTLMTTLTWMVKGGEEALPACCGTCSVCLEPIMLPQFCKLECDHVLHVQCAERLPSPLCPECRAPFVAGEWFTMV